MTRRRRLRRRLLWAGVFFGLVLLYAVVSTMRACLWCRDIVVGATKHRRRSHTRLRHVGARKGGTMYGRFSLAALVAATAVALAAPTAWADPWAADRHAQAQDAQQGVSSNPDWFERYAAAHSIREPVGDDHFRDRPDAATAPAATSGTETRWPELGLGVGLVIVLALAMLLTVRPTGVRPLPR
jgi:hypothetical protein